MNLDRRRSLEVAACGECPIRVSSMFCNLNAEDLGTLTASRASNIYKKGQPIFSEDRMPHGIYCIYSGKVKIHKDGENGKEQILRFARPGQLIGYRALLNDDPYMASATAMETSLVCYFPKQTFMSMLQKNPDLCLIVMRKIAEDLKTAEQQVISMSQKMASSRLAEALLMLKECYGYEPDTTFLRVKPSRRELANIAGTTTETAIRIIGELNEQGLISFDGKRIGLTREDKLRGLANAS